MKTTEAKHTHTQYTCHKLSHSFTTTYTTAAAGAGNKTGDLHSYIFCFTRNQRSATDCQFIYKFGGHSFVISCIRIFICIYCKHQPASEIRFDPNGTVNFQLCFDFTLIGHTLNGRRIGKLRELRRILSSIILFNFLDIFSFFFTARGYSMHNHSIQMSNHPFPIYNNSTNLYRSDRIIRVIRDVHDMTVRTQLMYRIL